MTWALGVLLFPSLPSQPAGSTLGIFVPTSSGDRRRHPCSLAPGSLGSGSPSCPPPPVATSCLLFPQKSDPLLPSRGWGPREEAMRRSKRSVQGIEPGRRAQAKRDGYATTGWPEEERGGGAGLPSRARRGRGGSGRLGRRLGGSAKVAPKFRRERPLVSSSRLTCVVVKDGGHVLLGEGVVGIAHEQARLAHRPVAHHHALEHQCAGPVSHAAAGRPPGMVPPEPSPRPRAQPPPAGGVLRRRRRRRRSAQLSRAPGPMQRLPSREGRGRRARGAAAAAALAARIPAPARVAAPASAAPGARRPLLLLLLLLPNPASAGGSAGS